MPIRISLPVHVTCCPAPRLLFREFSLVHRSASTSSFRTFGSVSFYSDVVNLRKRATHTTKTCPYTSSGGVNCHIPPGSGGIRCFTSEADPKPSSNSSARRSASSRKATTSSKHSPPDPAIDQTTTKPRIAAVIADRLSVLPRENIYTLPNILTFSRLLATPAIAWFIIHDYHRAAVGLLAYAGFTDLLDGWIARKWNLQTVVGTVVDPLADKALMTILTIALAVKGALPHDRPKYLLIEAIALVWVATLILGRDFSLALAAIYYRFASLPRPKTFLRFWDFGLPSASVHPTPISKFNTFLQLLLIGAATASPLVPAGAALPVALPMIGGYEASQVMQVAQWTVAGTTVWSGFSYLYTRNAVKILGEEIGEQEKRKILRRGRGVIAGAFLCVFAVAAWLET